MFLYSGEVSEENNTDEERHEKHLFIFLFYLFCATDGQNPLCSKDLHPYLQRQLFVYSFFNFLYFDIFFCIILILMLCIGVLLKSRHDFRIQRWVKGHHALGRFWVAFFTQRHRSAVSSLVCVKDFQKADAD